MNRQQYVGSLLEAYQNLPGVGTKVRAADRALAERLFHDDVPLDLVLVAFRVAISRRRSRRNDAPPLQPIRSLHYFLPVIEEARALPAEYLDFIARADRSPRTADPLATNCANSQKPALPDRR